ncbi:MAG: SMI1/KNR4 family protein [Thermoanaerobaculia bacterium]
MTSGPYGHLLVDAPKGPPTEAELAAIEEAVGAPIPEELREWLAAFNGGTLDYTFEVATEAGPFPLCFYSLYSTRRPSPARASAGLLLHELAMERRLKDVRPGLLPIAGDGGTSVLYVDLAPPGAGRVVAYVEGLPGWDGTTEGCFVEMAPDLPAYAAGLYLNTVEEPKRGG